MVGVFPCAEQEHSEVCVTDLSGTSLYGHEFISGFFPCWPTNTRETIHNQGLPFTAAQEVTSCKAWGLHSGFKPPQQGLLEIL